MKLIASKNALQVSSNLLNTLTKHKLNLMELATHAQSQIHALNATTMKDAQDATTEKSKRKVNALTKSKANWFAESNSFK
jgi:hypothetical protein